MSSSARWTIVLVLLAPAVVLPLLVGIYARNDPELFGFPFFFWFQFALIPVAAVLTTVAYQLTKARATAPADARGRPGGGHPMNGVAFGVFVFLFLLVTVLGFAAARWRRAKDLDSLDEWGLGGRGFGTFIAWFLIGGDIYTAYTFIAVPATLYAGSAVGFFAVPYTIVVYPLIFLFLPRLWSVSHRHGYVTPADFVEGRYDSRPLALAVALTGILATMPYIALQLVGMQVVLAGDGDRHGRATTGSSRTCRCSSPSRCSRPTPTRAGCARPALIAFVKDTLIYVVIIVAVLYLPAPARRLGPHLRHGRHSRSPTSTARTPTRSRPARPRPKAIMPPDAAALGVRDAGARVGAGAVHVPALGHRRALHAEPLGDPAQRRAAAGVLLPARAARAARLRRDRGRREGRPTRSRRCRSCSRTSSRPGSPASRSPRS